MDEIVLRGMAKWPNVPSVYGWLALDRRGHWLIKGERVQNQLVAAFIGRNYARDARGCWYFQNGPQRVFVDLHGAPFVLRIVSSEGTPLAIETHNGTPVAAVTGAWLDENGALLLATEHGPGLVHDRDLERLLPAFTDAGGNRISEDVLDELMVLAQGGKTVPLWLKFREARVKVETIAAREAPGRIGFVAHPEPPAGEEVCR